MLLPGENNSKTWLFVTILVSTIIALSESRNKMLDFKIGFDLTLGASGAPVLRIKDFKGSSEFNPRAMDKESEIEERLSDENNSKSSPEERPHPNKKEESTKEKDKSDDNDDDAGDEAGPEAVVRITRGPKNNDFEPEEDKTMRHFENPNIHAKISKDSEVDNSEKNSDEDRRRYRRHITYSVM